MNQRRILCVDDDALNLEVLEEVLDQPEYAIAFARSGEEALELLDEFGPELVLLDIMMPGIDGYETCRRMRARKGSECKVVLVSAKAMTSERLAGYEAGADDYITKPFDVDELRAKVNVFLRLQSAEKLDELKNELLSIVAHEIRTPLSGVLPAAELLRSGESMRPEERVEFADMIINSSTRLLELTDRAFQIAEMRSGAASLEVATIDLSGLARSVLMDPSFDGCALDAESVLIEGDAERLEEVIRLLVDNAHVHGAGSEAPRVEVRAQSGDAVVTVTDFGDGIDSESAAVLFEPFCERRSDGETVGSGLSLAYCRTVAEAHGGALDLDTSYQDGARFTLRLPLLTA